MNDKFDKFDFEDSAYSDDLAKVYVVFEECQEDRWIVGMFDSCVEAEKCKQYTEAQGRYGASVESWEVNRFFPANTEN